MLAILLTLIGVLEAKTLRLWLVLLGVGRREGKREERERLASRRKGGVKEKLEAASENI